MPQIDLGPNDYRKHDPKTGRWRMPHDPKLARNMFFVSCAMLVVLWFWRGTASEIVEFLLPIIIAFAGGILFNVWLKDVD